MVRDEEELLFVQLRMEVLNPPNNRVALSLRGRIISSLVWHRLRSVFDELFTTVFPLLSQNSRDCFGLAVRNEYELLPRVGPNQNRCHGQSLL